MDYDMPNCSETDLTTLSRTFIAAVAYLPPLTDDMLIDQATAISASSETTTKPQGRLRGPKKKKPSVQRTHRGDNADFVKWGHRVNKRFCPYNTVERKPRSGDLTRHYPFANT